MIIGVLGIGAMGKIIAKDLFNSYKGKIVLLGRNIEEIRKFAGKRKNIDIKYADVSNIKNMIIAFKGIDIIIHAVHHEFNINVMKACLITKTHYLDLGGLFHYTKKQLKLNKEFKKFGLIAVIGIGASPGITNILAKYTSRFFDKIENIEIKLGYKDFSTYKQESLLPISYSIQTFLEELSWKPAVFINGKTRFVDPLSGTEEYRFPKPIGIQRVQYAIHSEIATLPFTLKAKNVSFKMAFSEDLIDKIKTLRELGFLSEKGFNKKPTVNEITTEILKKLPKSIPNKINEREIIRVIVDGEKKGKKKKIIIDAKVFLVNESIDKDTGVPPSIMAQMIVKKQINKVGVFSPESIVPEKEFFKELAKRKIYIYKNNKKIN